MRTDIDTNVLVRFLTQDDPRQAQIASNLLQQGVHVQKIALVETDWVLRKVYGWKKKAVAKAFETLMRYAKVVVEDPQQVSEALTNWVMNSKSDFADCMLIAGSKDAFATFDKGLATLPRVQVL